MLLGLGETETTVEVEEVLGMLAFGVGYLETVEGLGVGESLASDA